MYYFCTFLYIFYSFIQFGLTQVVNNEGNINIELKEGTILHIKFSDLKRNDYDSCTNTGPYVPPKYELIGCTSNGKSDLNLYLQCKIVKEIQGNTHIQYINASSFIKLSADYAGNWNCSFSLIYKMQSEPKQYTFTVKIPFTNSEGITDPKWIYIASAISILALIIIAQTVCIIHFKRKARIRKRMERQSSVSANPPDNEVRYTTMPGQIKMEQSNKVPRESGIYEIVDKFPVPKPEPPPTNTIPRSNKATCETEQASLPRKPSPPPPTAKKPVKHKKNDRRNEDTISAESLERIKSRKPQPLPIEDPGIYEVMPGKPPIPAQAVPIFPTGNNVQVLPPTMPHVHLKPVPKPDKTKQALIEEPKTAPIVSKSIKKPPQQAPPVYRKPSAPLPIQPIPVDNGSTSSDEEWTYETITNYNQDNIYDNVPRY